MSVNDYFTFAVDGSDTTPNFQLSGGTYGLSVTAASWGTAVLNVQTTGGTFVPVQSFSADGAVNLILVAGLYQWVYASVTTGQLTAFQQPSRGGLPGPVGPVGPIGPTGPTGP